MTDFYDDVEFAEHYDDSTDGDPTPADEALHDWAEYIAGLRLMADVLEAHPEIILPWPGQSPYMNFEFYVTGERDEKATTAAIIRALGGHWSKDASDAFFTTQTQVRGLHVRVVATRDQVCVRRVVGQKTVTKKIATVYEEKNVVEDIVEWDCAPILRT